MNINEEIPVWSAASPEGGVLRVEKGEFMYWLILFTP